MRRFATVAVVLAVALAGCGGSGSGGSGGAAGAGGTLTAESVLAELKERFPTISATTVYTAASDPNSLLGRPGQYTSKAGFHDDRVPAKEVEYESQPFAVRRGGDIEVFESAGEAEKREKYIATLMKEPAIAAMAGIEYIYREGRVLLRVSGALTPDVAAEYERALGEVA
jgi:hypothetical protein